MGKRDHIYPGKRNTTYKEAKGKHRQILTGTNIGKGTINNGNNEGIRKNPKGSGEGKVRGRHEQVKKGKGLINGPLWVSDRR